MVTYRHGLVLEGLRECLGHGILMLLFNNAWCCCEDSECCLPLARIRRLAELEKNLKELWPRIVCKQKCQYLILNLMLAGDALLS